MLGSSAQFGDPPCLIADVAVDQQRSVFILSEAQHLLALDDERGIAV
jgi:hypothetical protein